MESATYGFFPVPGIALHTSIMRGLDASKDIDEGANRHAFIVSPSRGGVVKKNLGAVFFGVGLALVAAFGVGAVQRRKRYVAGWREPLVDINTATREQLMSLGIVESFTLQRLEENRPYRNKLDLVSRMIIPEALYDQIKRDIVVRGAEEPIKIAG